MDRDDHSGFEKILYILYHSCTYTSIVLGVIGSDQKYMDRTPRGYIDMIGTNPKKQSNLKSMSQQDPKPQSYLGVD